MNEIGNRIKLIRNKVGYTQTKLAEELGFKQVDVSRYEKGSGISVDFIQKLHKKFNINIHWLFTGEGTDTIENNEKQTMVNGTTHTDSDDLTQIKADMAKMMKLVQSLVDEQNQMKQELSELKAKTN